MLSELGRTPMLGNNENSSFGIELEKEMGHLFSEQRRQEADVCERELNMYRSGSAPPTVEGSLSAVGGLFSNHRGAGEGAGGGPVFTDVARSSNGFMSEDELRSDPAYLSYYYSNVNLNPRLPPPLLSKEDWRFAQRLQGGSSAVGDRKNRNFNESGRSPFSMPPGFNMAKKQGCENESEKVHSSAEWGGAGLIGLPGSGLGPGNKQKSLAEIFQDDLSCSTPVSRHPSRPVSRDEIEKNSDAIGSSEAELVYLHPELVSINASRSSTIVQKSLGSQHAGSAASYSYAAALGGSLSRSNTPDPEHIARVPSPCLAPIGGGRISNSERRSLNSPNSFNDGRTHPNEPSNLVAALSGVNLSNGSRKEGSNSPSLIGQGVEGHNIHDVNLPGGENTSKQHAGQFKVFPVTQSGEVRYPESVACNNNISEPRLSSLNGDMHTGASYDPYLRGYSTSMQGKSLLSQHQQLNSLSPSFSNYGVNGYSTNPFSSQLGNYNLPPLFENAAATAMGLSGMDSRVLGGSIRSPGVEQNLNRLGNQFAGNGLLMDPTYLQYLRTVEYGAALYDPGADKTYMGNGYVDLLEKAYHGALVSPQKSQCSLPLGGKGSVSNYYYGNPTYGLGMAYPGSPLASSVVPNSPVGPSSPMQLNDFNMRFSGGTRNTASGSTGPWHFNCMGTDDSYASTLLEEFKSNKMNCFELCVIKGHVIEFSVDQYGSRFIQQKLETATTEEKGMVFQEIAPQALTLMTDVFGNYVIQKFFEYGMETQRQELSSKLYGHVLTLSLQMYGCRVIQKAIEVVDVDLKRKMAEELDGHVMRCVRDQNGNHVVQKCIECIPEDHIQFIVSTFYGQVVTLSTHPYGCRVIQRVLEHCKDPITQSKVMEEILGSVSMLAQDQYGNYVIQHLLEHGKSLERTAIIQELAGNIVQMSQQKFASNVVEKCLTFGDPSERQLLVNEMLGLTDENEPLQAMMKDQFANYVVQKVLETCSDQERQLILSRIKVHLNALKKYTYGKHIVARVEKLVAAGERRIAALRATPAY